MKVLNPSFVSFRDVRIYFRFCSFIKQLHEVVPVCGSLRCSSIISASFGSYIVWNRRKNVDNSKFFCPLSLSYNYSIYQCPRSLLLNTLSFLLRAYIVAHRFQILRVSYSKLKFPLMICGPHFHTGACILYTPLGVFTLYLSIFAMQAIKHGI